MKTIFTCLFVSVALFVSAQQNTFKVRTFEAANSSLGIGQLVQLNDGNFVGLGGFYKNENGDTLYPYLLKTDPNGNVLAAKEIEKANTINGNSLTKTTDGGFALCAELDGETAIMKFTSDFTPQWQKKYIYDSGYVGFKKILQSADGGYMLFGYIYNYDDDASYDYVMKTDASGNILLSKKYLSSELAQPLDMVATTDGNYAFLGGTATGIGGDSAYVVKIKPDGSILWTSYLVSKGQIVYPTAMAATSDGGIIITGDADTIKTGLYTDRLLMAKYNSAGGLQWSKDIVTTNYIESYAVTLMEDADGGYLFAGELDKFTDLAHNNYDTSYGYIVKANASGSLLWTKTFEPNIEGFTYFANLIKTADGGYAACGYGSFYYSPDNEYNDGGFVYKFNSNFQACNEEVGSKGTAQNFGRNISINTTVGDIIIDNEDATISLTGAGATDNVCNTNALPLQLLSFNASLQNKSVNINWTTANEVNTNYFVVERSANGASFTALQQVASKGNNSGTQVYNINDLQPLQGTSYYRLKQIDKDGKTTYSSIAKVTVLSNGTIVISPNPVQSSIRVVIQSTISSTATLQVVDMNGRVLAAQKTALTTGTNVVSIPASSLAKGVYMLKVIGSQSTDRIRFVKE